MKILSPGTKPEPKPPEWVGMKLTCACGCEVELEDRDRACVEERFERKVGGVRWVQMDCPTCGRVMRQLAGDVTFEELRELESKEEMGKLDAMLRGRNEEIKIPLNFSYGGQPA